MATARILTAVVSALIVALVATYVAGELEEVAVLRTFDETGAPHDTKLWICDVDGVPWVRLARPGREWFRRLERDPRALLVRGGAPLPVLARADPVPEMRATIDAAFRSKYGVVDWWYGIAVRRDSLPIRLDPRAPEGDRGGQGSPARRSAERMVGSPL